MVVSWDLSAKMQTLGLGVVKVNATIVFFVQQLQLLSPTKYQDICDKMMIPRGSVIA